MYIHDVLLYLEFAVMSQTKYFLQACNVVVVSGSRVC